MVGKNDFGQQHYHLLNPTQLRTAACIFRCQSKRPTGIAISRLEVLGFYQLSLQDKIDFEDFFASVSILPIDETIISEAIRLRQQRKRSIGDSIIAATGLLYNQPVLTNNVPDFSDVDGLRIIALANILTT